MTTSYDSWVKIIKLEYQQKTEEGILEVVPNDERVWREAGRNFQTRRHHVMGKQIATLHAKFEPILGLSFLDLHHICSYTSVIPCNTIV